MKPQLYQQLLESKQNVENKGLNTINFDALLQLQYSNIKSEVNEIQRLKRQIFSLNQTIQRLKNEQCPNCCGQKAQQVQSNSKSSNNGCSVKVKKPEENFQTISKKLGALEKCFAVSDFNKRNSLRKRSIRASATSKINSIQVTQNEIDLNLSMNDTQSIFNSSHMKLNTENFNDKSFEIQDQSIRLENQQLKEQIKELNRQNKQLCEKVYILEQRESFGFVNYEGTEDTPNQFCSQLATLLNTKNAYTIKYVDEETRNKLQAVDILIKTNMRDRKIVQQEHSYLKELRQTIQEEKKELIQLKNSIQC